MCGIIIDCNAITKRIEIAKLLLKANQFSGGSRERESVRDNV